jgi:hypothetical protein
MEDGDACAPPSGCQIFFGGACLSDLDLIFNASSVEPESSRAVSFLAVWRFPASPLLLPLGERYLVES